MATVTTRQQADGLPFAGVAAPLDVFPARLDSPIGVLDGVRVILDYDRLLVFTRGEGRDVHLASTARTASVTQDRGGRRARTTVTDVDGGTWTFWANGTCGCGSPFKRWSRAALLALADGG